MTVQLSTREKFFSAKQCIRNTFKINDIELEIKKPLVGEVLPYSEGIVNSDGKRVLREMSIVNFLLDFAYDLGTNIKVFDETDREGLLNVPYTQEFHAVYLHVLSSLTGIDVGNAVKNSEETSLNKTV